jgi:hypothetical protein
MIVAILANHILDFLGVVFIVSTAVKIARGYPITRWFF